MKSLLNLGIAVVAFLSFTTIGNAGETKDKQDGGGERRGEG